MYFIYLRYEKRFIFFSSFVFISFETEKRKKKRTEFSLLLILLLVLSFRENNESSE